MACELGSTSGIDGGIFLTTGDFIGLTLRGNGVDGATVALGLGQNVGPLLRVTNAAVWGIVFRNSLHADSGQITVTLRDGERVEARISDNSIQGGAGYGVLCKGAGAFLLKNLIANDFIDNVKGDSFGCP